MGKKDKKSFGRQELADWLANLSRQVASGRVEGETGAWAVPEQVEAAIHFKEEDGEVTAKLKFSWPVPKAAAGAGAPPPIQLSLKEVKTRLAACFKELRQAIPVGRIPEPQVVKELVEYSRAFGTLAKPEWQKGMADFLDHVNKLKTAAADGQMEVMQQELEILADRMNLCHREFK